MKKIILTILLNALLIANENNVSKIETGWNFYENDNITKEDKKCNCKDFLTLLKEMKSELAEQTKIQKEILALLKKEIDPEPEKIVVNGKECVANSSAECFKMPVTAEAKKIPALQMWLENPTLQNAANYLQWQSKYFKEVFKRADMFPAAINQFGTEAYPLNYRSVSYINLSGFDPRKNATKKYLNNSIARLNLEFVAFFGDNLDLDIMGVYGLEKIVDTYTNINPLIVFKDKKSKKIFESMVEVLPGSNRLKNSKKIVNSEYFEKLNIFTTPAIAIINQDNAQTLVRGKLQEGIFTEALYNYLEMNDLLEHSQLADYKTWTNNTNYRKQFYKSIYGIRDIDKLLKDEGMKQ